MLVLIWALVGALVGVLVEVGRLGFGARGLAPRGGRLATLALGMISAVVSGAAGIWIYGTLVATPLAVWGAVTASVVLPWVVQRVASRERAA